MKNNKGFGVIAILLIIVGVLAIGGGAYYVGKSSNLLPQNVKENNLQQEEQNQNVVNTSVQNTEEDCLPTTTPWVKVISPNGGENYNIGGKITVKWDSCNVSSSSYDIFVALHQNGEWQNVAYLSNSTINDGSETFTIPTVTLGNYKVRVGSASATVKQDWSDNSFTINSTTTTNLRKDGETCGENIWDCEAGLKCAYPCGIPGCQYICMPKDTPPVP